ncbi:MAG: hypothetical protein FWE17_00400, partial [Alphaproteobacteria bacterium]|nr:hypothetical protein [Alphaproteobacteria bacterium]
SFRNYIETYSPYMSAREIDNGDTGMTIHLDYPIRDRYVEADFILPSFVLSKCKNKYAVTAKFIYKDLQSEMALSDKYCKSVFNIAHNYLNPSKPANPFQRAGHKIRSAYDISKSKIKTACDKITDARTIIKAEAFLGHCLNFAGIAISVNGLAKIPDASWAIPQLVFGAIALATGHKAVADARKEWVNLEHIMRKNKKELTGVKYSREKKEVVAYSLVAGGLCALLLSFCARTGSAAHILSSSAGLYAFYTALKTGWMSKVLDDKTSKKG